MRKHYIDNIRWVTIIIVVIFHIFYYFNNIGIDSIFDGLPVNAADSSAPFRLSAVFQYAVYPWFMTLLFVVAGISANCALKKKTNREFIKARVQKLIVPSTLGVLVFGWIPGSLVTNAAAGESFAEVPGFVKYIIYTCSGIGALWFCHVLFLASLILVLIKCIDKKGKLVSAADKLPVFSLIFIFFLMWGSSKVLNMPVIVAYRLGIYTISFLLGYYIFSQDRIIEYLKKWRWITLAAAIISGAAFIIYWYGTSYSDITLLSSFISNLYTFFAILAILGIFAKYFDKTGKAAEFCSKMSWPVYILHIPMFLIALTLMDKYTEWPVIVKYIILLVTGFIITPAAGLAVEKIPVIRYLILGIKGKKKAKNASDENKAGNNK